MKTVGRLLFDFQCTSCTRKSEQFIDSSITQISCSCGNVMHRTISTPRITLDGTDPGFPTAYDRWATQHEKAGRPSR